MNVSIRNRESASNSSVDDTLEKLLGRSIGVSIRSNGFDGSGFSVGAGRRDGLEVRFGDDVRRGELRDSVDKDLNGCGSERERHGVPDDDWLEDGKRTKTRSQSSVASIEENELKTDHQRRDLRRRDRFGDPFP